MKRYGLLIVTVATTIICMPIMLYLFTENAVYAGNMRLEDDSPEYGSDVVSTTLDDESDIQLVEGMTFGTEISLGIPLDIDTETDKISVFEDKAASLIRIRIPTEDKSFYYRNQLTGSQKGIASVVFDHSDKMAEFNISTDGYYIATVHLIPNKLFLELNTPKELYGHVYVIDAPHGGEDIGNSAYGVCEKDLTLDIAKRISDVAASTGIGGIYLTRSTDEAVSDQDRARLIELLKPDIYVTLHVDADEKTRVTNGVRGVTNEREEQNGVKGLISVIASETGQQDLGVTIQNRKSAGEAGESGVREVDIYTGYVTNKAEALKMSEGSYTETVARVILAWLMQED